MLRVTLEMVPFGDEQEKRSIGVMTISRMQALGNPCDYRVRLMMKDQQQEFVVRAHRYEDGAWELVRRAAEAVCGVQRISG